MAVWDAAYINDLPDSAFLLIAPGGKKDAQGRTIPRGLRYFPVENAAGTVDAAHLRNALAQIPKASTLSANQREEAMSKAKALAKDHASVGGPSGTYAGSAGSGRQREPVPVEFRSYEFLSLEMREDGNGRTLMGRAVPYGETADIPGGTERFVLGAFARQIAGAVPGAVKLYESHNDRRTSQTALGKTTSLVEMTDGLHGTWEMYETTRANDALVLIRAQELTGLSIGFKALPGGSRTAPDGTIERHIAHLDHVALTLDPVYQGAAVTAVRSSDPRGLDSFRRDQLKQQQVLERIKIRL